jgi:signal transduction histidine kinase
MPIEIVPLVDETLRIFVQDRRDGAASARLHAGPGAGEAWVEADPGQLRQVIWNLLRNAAEAMPDGGEVTITVGASGGQAELVVADQGMGISRDDQEHIFEPFFTTKKRGTGLGLAIVHKVVTDHGGQVDVDSVPGRGTRVTVRLPVAAAPSGPAPLSPS